ncbi:MAG: histidine kinase [Bacteroidia bacterium]|nr:histidine kinase [Bacteroidia bacterium]
MLPLLDSDHIQDQDYYKVRPASDDSIPKEEGLTQEALFQNTTDSFNQLMSVSMGQIESWPLELQLKHYNQLGYAALVNQEEAISDEGYRRAIMISESNGEVWEMLDNYVDYSGLKLFIGDLPSSQELADKAELLLMSFPRANYKAYQKCRVGYLQIAYYNHSKAHEYFIDALRLMDSLESLDLKDRYYQILIYSGLGAIHSRNRSHQLAAKSYQKAYEIANKYGISSQIAITCLNLSNGYLQNEQWDLAEEILTERIDLLEPTDSAVRAGMLANLGYCRMQKGAFLVASRLFNEAKTVYKGLPGDQIENLFKIERWLAMLSMNIKTFDSARDHFKKAFKLAEKIKGFKALSTIYKDISDYYKTVEDYKSAFEYAALYNEAIQNYHEEVSDQKRYELEIKYETEQKEKEAELLKLQAAKLQLKALRAQMNPHFIYNALNAIQHFISSRRDKDAATYLAKFAVLMRKSLDYSDKEYISLEDEVAFIRDYLEINQKLRFEESLSYSIHVQESIEDDLIGLPSMIIQPYVENAIEHGIRLKPDGHIEISFIQTDEAHVLCSIEDNGIGRTAALEHKAAREDYPSYESRGTNITEQRLQLINKTNQKSLFVKTIDLYDEGEKPIGTRVEIRIPVITIKS